jgi:hypothetical protein
VSELAKPFDISLPAISRHLKVLERAGLIARGLRRNGGPAGSSRRRSRASTTGSKTIAGSGSSGSIGSRTICIRCKPRRPAKSGRGRVAEKNSLGLDDPTMMVGMRVLDAPRELVWQDWTDPKHLAQWWGPDGFTTTTSAYDFRQGGAPIKAWCRHSPASMIT